MNKTASEAWRNRTLRLFSYVLAGELYEPR